MIGPYGAPRKRRVTKLDLSLGFLILVAVLWLGPAFIYAGGYRWDWSVIPRYLVRTDRVTGELRPNVLLNGFFTTLRLSIWSGILAMIIGLVMGTLATRRRPLARMITRTYVEFARNTPPLVLVFLFYYFLGDQIVAILGIDRWAGSLGPIATRWVTVLAAPPRQLPAFVSAVATLGIFEGAYLSEIVRAGIQSVPRGQWEAGYALGFSPRDRFRFVILPQAWRVVLPATVGQFISIIKDSSIVAIISIPEMTFQGLEVMAGTYRTFEIWIFIAAMYFLLSALLSGLAHFVERHIAIPGSTKVS